MSADIKKIEFSGAEIQDYLVAKYLRETEKFTDEQIKAEAIKMYNMEAATSLGKECNLTYGQEKRLAYKFIRQFLEDSLLSCNMTDGRSSISVSVINSLIKKLEEQCFLLEETDITENYEVGFTHILHH